MTVTAAIANTYVSVIGSAGTGSVPGVLVNTDPAGTGAATNLSLFLADAQTPTSFTGSLVGTNFGIVEPFLQIHPLTVGSETLYGVFYGDNVASVPQLTLSNDSSATSWGAPNEFVDPDGGSLLYLGVGVSGDTAWMVWSAANHDGSPTTSMFIGALTDNNTNFPAFTKLFDPARAATGTVTPLPRTDPISATESGTTLFDSVTGEVYYLQTNFADFVHTAEYAGELSFLKS